jgi:hypothetical protein
MRYSEHVSGSSQHIKRTNTAYLKWIKFRYEGSSETRAYQSWTTLLKSQFSNLEYGKKKCHASTAMVAILWHLHLGKFQRNKIHSDQRREANLPVNVVISRESCQNSSSLRRRGTSQYLRCSGSRTVSEERPTIRNIPSSYIHELLNAQSYFHGHVYRAHLVCDTPPPQSLEPDL